MINRAEGWYWIRHKFYQSWQVGRWLDGRWDMVGRNGSIPEKMIIQVGPRLHEPEKVDA